MPLPSTKASFCLHVLSSSSLLLVVVLSYDNWSPPKSVPPDRTRQETWSPGPTTAENMVPLGPCIYGAADSPPVGENNIELQIWRSSGSGPYNRVRSTVVTVATSNATWVYHLPTNLSFQAGDILGFYLLSDSRFRLRLAVHMDPLQTVYLRNGNPDAEFGTTASNSSRMQDVLVSVEPGKLLVYLNLSPTMHFPPCVYRPSRLWEWFHECGDHVYSSRTRRCWKIYWL